MYSKSMFPVPRFLLPFFGTRKYFSLLKQILNNTDNEVSLENLDFNRSPDMKYYSYEIEQSPFRPCNGHYAACQDEEVIF